MDHLHRPKSNSKKVILAPSGSDGDIFPMLAFGKKLRERGHEVLIASVPSGREFAEKLGFPLIETGLDVKNWTRNRDLSRGTFAARSRDIRFMQDDIRKQISFLRAAAQGSYAIFSGGYNYAAATVAESLGIRHLHIFHVPNVYPTGDYPCMSVPWQGMPKILNRVTWTLNRTFQNLLFRKTINSVRETLSLPPIRDVWKNFTENSIVAAPPVLHRVPENSGHSQTGYWSLDADEPLPPELLEFIHRGPKPFYFGFGSMSTGEKSKIIEAVKAVCRQFKTRAIISKGWAEFEIDRDFGRNSELFLAGRVSHANLFPLLDLVVHHGGPGTITTAGKSGVVQILVPHLFDQFYWGARVHAAGLGPKPIHRNDFSAAALIQRFGAVQETPAYRRRALELQPILQASDGIEDFFRPEFLKSIRMDL